MATGPQPTLESLAEFVQHLLQQNEQVQANLVNVEEEKQQIVNKLKAVEDESRQRITNLEAQINILNANTAELERKLNVGTANERDRELKRIMGINLLKGKEFEKFNKKDSYELWVDGIKNDLYSQLPDARAFVEFAENPPLLYGTDINGKIHLTPGDVKQAINDTLKPFDCDPKVAQQVDFKIYSLLNNLTREHPVAHGKIKMNNANDKLGTLAWYNLRNFFHEETAEYKTTCMKHALNVTKCNNMDQLATKLDQWLYAVAKIAKLDPSKALPDEYQFVIFKQLITKNLEDVIETNKTD